MYRASLEFWDQNQGGRITPPQSGFRPQLEVGSVHTSCKVSSLETSITVFKFDKEYSVVLELMYPDRVNGEFKVGDTVRLFEGCKQIAEGTISRRMLV